MNIENYKRFLEAIGHQVVASSSGYWYNVSTGFYKSILPHKLLSPTKEEFKNLFRENRAIGFIYYASKTHLGKPSWIYICQGKDYDIARLHPKMRNKVRQGLRDCFVKQISFEYLRDHAMVLNRDTLIRQARSDSLFTDPQKWAQLCQAGIDIPGASTWGAFVEDQLAAYLITFMVDDVCSILYQKSRSDLLSYHANNALAFVVTKEFLGKVGVQSISYGEESIRDLPGLDEFKIRMAYEKQPVRSVVTLHPLFDTLFVNQITESIIAGLYRVFPNLDFIKRIFGTFTVAKLSRGSAISPN